MTIAKVIAGFGETGWGGGGSTTSPALSYTTTAVDQNIILEIATENASGTYPVIASVADTNGLTWAKRGATQTGTTSEPAFQAVEVWWAHAPTAVSGTITVTMTGVIDIGVISGIILQGAVNPSAPWDTNGSLPAHFSDVTGSPVAPSATISTTNPHTLVLAMGSNPRGFSQSVAGGLTLNDSRNTSSGVNWEDTFFASQFFATAQTSTTIALGTSTGWFQFLIVDAIAVVGDPSPGVLAVDTTLKNNPSLSTSTATTAALTTSQTPIVLVMGVCLANTNGTSNPDITSVTDTAGLTWARRARLNVDDASSGFQLLDVWWAFAPNGVVADTITLHYATQPVTGAYEILAISGSPSPSAPWDANGSLPASASNATGTGSTPAVASVAVTASSSLVLAWQNTRQATSCVPPSGFTDVGAQNNEPGGGSDRAYMDVGYKAESSAVSSTTFTSASGSIAPWGMIVDALSGNAGGNIWASTETPDTASFVVTGYPGVIGNLLSTETPDSFAAIGATAVVGTMILAETPDSMSARMIQPIRGALAVTETKDAFVAHGVGYGVNIALLSTEALDRMVADVVAIQPTHGVLDATETPDSFRALTSGATTQTQNIQFFVA